MINREYTFHILFLWLKWNITSLVETTDLYKDGQCVSASYRCSKMKLSYSGHERCHIAPVTSNRSQSLRRWWSCSIEFQHSYIHLLDHEHGSSVSYDVSSFFIAPNNWLKPNSLKLQKPSFFMCTWFIAYTAAGHQGAMEMFWPHMLSIFIQSKVENNLTRHVSNIAKLQQKTNTRGINRVTLNASQSDVGTEVTVHFVPLWAQSAPNNEADVMLEEGHRIRTVN